MTVSRGCDGDGFHIMSDLKIIGDSKIICEQYTKALLIMNRYLPKTAVFPTVELIAYTYSCGGCSTQYVGDDYIYIKNFLDINTKMF